MEEKLEQIKVFADRAHGDQQRKYTPERYIAHPVRVMETCRQYIATLPVLAAALLHDVLEDTGVQPPELHDFLLQVLKPGDAAQALKLVTELTDVYTKAEYPRLNRRRRKIKETARLSNVSAAAQTIKYADIMDNTKAIARQDPGFAPVYLQEARALLDVMRDGDPKLHERAMEIVREELGRL